MQQYLNLLETVLEQGAKKGDRTAPARARCSDGRCALIWLRAFRC